jgi:5-methylcytosine-specific restriction endonuclease McrA
MLVELRVPELAEELERAAGQIALLLETIAAAPASASVDELLDAAGWESGRTKPLKDGVAAVAQLPADERAAIRSAFVADAAYAGAFDDKSFAFSFKALARDTRSAAKALLRPMYELCVPRHRFEQAFRSANPGVKVCPACLVGGLPRPVGRTLVKVDHTLPRAWYPHLSAHLENLVLMCGECNDLKHDRDPLVEAGETLPLTRTYLPYRRPALPEIAFVFSLGQWSAPIVSLEGSSEATRLRIQTLDRLLRLEQRWSDYLEDCGDALLGALREAHGAGAVRAEVEQHLLRLAREAELSGFRVGGRAVEERWLAWLAQDALDAIMAELSKGDG